VGATPNLGARDHYQCYDSTWRLASLRTGSCSGTVVTALGYDVQGNLASKGGVTYSFDYGNRLRQVQSGGSEVESYRYDVHGRRVRSLSGAGALHSMYANDGQLLFQKNERTGKSIDYILLGGSVVAQVERPIAGGTATTTYQHTDALGSPVASTDASRVVVESSEYEPYGRVGNRTSRDGVGYTGHAEDAATGLVYMQQRYYDPSIGRFPSIDPVGPDPNTGANFNGYKYAANNPYSFKDLDGRQECRSCEMSYGASVGYMLRNDPEKMRIWAGGEAVATTAGSGAEEGAAMGQAVGDFVDTGNYSKQAVATLATVVVVGALTHGKSRAGLIHSPSPKINLGQQGKHQVGHNNYIPGRSVLTGNPSELGRYAGTGQQIGTKQVGLPGSKERVNFGQGIGSYVDQAGNATPTTNGIIHYGKDGVHIVPSRPDP